MNSADFPVTKILLFLEADNLLPAILFRTSRRQCDRDIEFLGERPRFTLSPNFQQDIQEAIGGFLNKYGFEEELVTGHPHYRMLIELGVGSHHAGQLLVWRLLLEELMSAGLLRLLIATGTVAAGVDFPARSVVITAHSKRGSEGFNVLSASEMQQMSGRAGRRGRDTVGFCLVAPSKFSDARVVADIAKRPPEPLRSAYFAAPSTVLNLLKFRTVDDLRYLVQHSLASFLDRNRAAEIRREAEQVYGPLMSKVSTTNAEGEVNGDIKRSEKRYRRRLREAEELEQQQLRNLQITVRSLEGLGYLQGELLSEKGFWAAELCTSLVLQLAEAVNDGLFSECSVEELISLVASISGDRYRAYLGIRKNPIKKELFERLNGICARIETIYDSPQLQEGVNVSSEAAVTALTWAESESWADFASLLRLGGVAEGDAARLITQTADNLNQLSRLVKSHPELAMLAEEGRARLLRPPLLDVGTQTAIAANG